jgi:hypothetical protein
MPEDLTSIVLYYDDFNFSFHQSPDSRPMNGDRVPAGCTDVVTLHVFGSDEAASAFADGIYSQIGENDGFFIHEAAVAPAMHCVLIVDRRDPGAPPGLRRVDHRG